MNVDSLLDINMLAVRSNVPRGVLVYVYILNTLLYEYLFLYSTVDLYLQASIQSHSFLPKNTLLVFPFVQVCCC